MAVVALGLQEQRKLAWGPMTILKALRGHRFSSCLLEERERRYAGLSSSRGSCQISQRRSLFGFGEFASTPIGFGLVFVLDHFSLGSHPVQNSHKNSSFYKAF